MLRAIEGGAGDLVAHRAGASDAQRLAIGGRWRRLTAAGSAWRAPARERSTAGVRR
ncbi:MAG: hypothetical protein WKF94_06295 [Solirubrobacteraceae bacterium]